MVRKLRSIRSPWAASGLVADCSFTIGPEVADVRNVAIQLKDGQGKALTERASVFAYLSSDAEGDVLLASAPTTVAIGTNGMAIELITKKVWQLQSNASGQIDLDITIATAATYYLIVVLGGGKMKASSVITFAITTTTGA
jgi:hypothetical protein